VKKLLPIVLSVIVLSLTRCDTEDQQCVNPGFILAGVPAEATCAASEPTDTAAYSYQQNLFDDYKLKINYSHLDAQAGTQVLNTIELGSPTNVEYVAVAGSDNVKRLALNDSISATSNWKVYNASIPALLVRDEHGPLANSLDGDWYDSKGYIGIRVLKNSQYYYGWIKLQVFDSNFIYVTGWSIYRD
jgi:hypothetical protein